MPVAANLGFDVWMVKARPKKNQWSCKIAARKILEADNDFK